MNFDVASRVKRIIKQREDDKVSRMNYETALSQVTLEFKKRRTRVLINEYAKYLREWMTVHCKYDLKYLSYKRADEHEIVLENSFVISEELKEIAKFYMSLDEDEKALWKAYMVEHDEPNNLTVEYEIQDRNKYGSGWDAASDDLLYIKF